MRANKSAKKMKSGERVYPEPKPKLGLLKLDRKPKAAAGDGTPDAA